MKDNPKSPIFEIELLNSEVDAGTQIKLLCKILDWSAEDAPDLDDPGGTLLQINDQYGKLVKSLELTKVCSEVEAEANQVFECTISAPIAPGTYTWSAVFPTQDTENVAFVESFKDFTFNVKPHCIRVVSWDAPAAIECGKPFSMKIGVKCSSECRPGNWLLSVRNQDGENLASSKIGEDVLPGTAALYYREVQLTAPHSEGLYSWQVRASALNTDIPHADCSALFKVRAVAAPECVITVEAIDQESRTPVEGVKVVVHPYKAYTDQCGVAQMKVPKGQYALFVSGKNYFPFRNDSDVQSDTTIRAELTVDRELSDADIWI